ncbi:MAG: TetR/AcrR family transcriptional regulator [Bacillota bacterium]
MPKSTFHHLPPEKKERILSAARAVYAKVPFKDLTISMVVEKADIARGSFYQYFEGLEDLYRALFEDALENFEHHEAELIDRLGNVDPFTFFKESFPYDHAYMKDTKEHTLFRKFFKERHLFGVAFDFLQQRHNESYRRLMRRLDMRPLEHMDAHDQLRTYRLCNHLKFQLLNKILENQAPYEDAYDDFLFYLSLLEKGAKVQA